MNNNSQMTHKGTVTLETERLILRHFIIDDAEAMFHNWASDPDVVRFMLYSVCNTLEATRTHIDQWLLYFAETMPGARELFAIMLKSTGELIGTIDYAETDLEERSAEVGYQIGKTWWGMGYTAEALRTVLTHCFETIKLNRVWADYDTRNPNSGKVMQKAGMFYEGTFRQCKMRRGQLIDKTQYAILAEDYFGQRKAEVSVAPNKRQYRLAVLSDAPELLKLNDLFNGEGCNKLTAIESSLRNNTQEIVCVAADGETLIGFCCGQIFKSMCYDVNYGEITELFVVESYRRQGVANGLMSVIESEFQKQGINHFQLFTGGENKIGQAFYNKQGYNTTTEVMFCKRPQNGELKND